MEVADSASAAPAVASVADADSTDSIPVSNATSPAVAGDERLDLLLAQQEDLGRRLDSLIALGEGNDRLSDAMPPGTGSGEVIEEASEQVQNFGFGLMWSIVVVFTFGLLIRALVWVLDTLAERSASRRLFYKRLVPIVRITLWTFAVYLIVRVPCRAPSGRSSSPAP